MSTPLRFSLLATVAVALSLSGCSWFRHRNLEPAPVEAATVDAAAVDAATVEPAASPLTPQELARVRTVAADFYEMHRRLGARGLPDAGTINGYRSFLCPQTSALFDDASRRQKEFIAAHPEDKPPLIEGDLFSSLFEGADSAEAESSEATAGGARVSLLMRHGEGGSRQQWHDTLLLHQQDGVWCVADVEYHGEWPFAQKGRLSDALKAEF